MSDDAAEAAANDEEPPVPEEERRPKQPRPRTGPACPSCGAPVDPRQLVCLECGGRVALKEHRSWASDPLAPMAAALVALIVIGAGLFGFAVSELTSDDDGDEALGSRRRRSSTSRGGRAQRARPSSGAEQETASSTETAPPGGDRPGAIPGWPAGLRAHTVVLVTTSDGPAARSLAREARRTGLEAGLIRSDPYGLGSGLWIVFTGRFDTREGAVRQAAGLQQQYPGAYPQLVQRSQ